MGGGDNKVEETEFEKAQADIALKRMADYQNDFKPYEDKFMEEVSGLNSAAKYQRAGELATNPLAKAFADEAVNIQESMNATGVNPNSGKAKSVKSAVAGAQASAEVDAGSRANASQQDNYVSGLQNVVAMGQGQTGSAMSGMSDIAQMGQRNAINEARNKLSTQSNIRSGIGGAVGAGVAYGMRPPKSKTEAEPDPYGRVA
jgi:hypothetical protein